MNSQEEKQAAKKAPFEEQATTVQAEAAATHGRMRRMAEAISFGQPILVGHHSEISPSERDVSDCSDIVL